jgi:hypothetical protein
MTAKVFEHPFDLGELPPDICPYAYNRNQLTPQSRSDSSPNLPTGHYRSKAHLTASERRTLTKASVDCIAYVSPPLPSSHPSWLTG